MILAGTAARAIRTAVILAGGKGTRFAAVSQGRPKSLAEISGCSVLEHQIHCAQRYGVQNFLLLIGHKGDEIVNHFREHNRFPGKNIALEFIKEEQALGSAGAVAALRERMTEDFFVFYGDTMLDIDLLAFAAFHAAHMADATLVVHPNDHPFDSDLLACAEDGRVTNFFPKPHLEGSVLPNLVNAAAYVLSLRIFDYLVPGAFADFGRDILPQMVADDARVFGYRTAEYIKDMGTAKRYAEVCHAVETGRVARCNRNRPRPAVFIDRDGTLCRYVDHLRRPEQLELITGVGAALRRINHSDYLAICITNQPMIAKGMLTFGGLREIHWRLESELGSCCAFLDRIYFCPHHPERGFEGEVPELKQKCRCRKPSLGMIEAAASEYNIDLAASVMIGDTTIDIQTGKNAGMMTILVQTGVGGTDGTYDVVPDRVCEDLPQALEFVSSLNSIGDTHDLKGT